MAFLWVLCLGSVLLTPILLPPLSAAAPATGPLAKVAPDLQALFEAYEVAQRDGRSLILPDPTMPVVEDRVTIDAVASESVEALKSRLVGLGMRGAATAGRMVSGQLPISQIAAMAALPELRFARAARSMTHRGRSGDVR